MAKIAILATHAEALLTFRKEMMLAMAKKNEVIALAPITDNNIIQRLNELGVKYLQVNISRTGLNPITDFKTIIELCKIFSKLKVDKLFCFTAKSVIFGSIAARISGVKNIYSMITGLGSYYTHSNYKTIVIRTIMSALYKIALLFNAKVFFQNPDDVADFKRFGIFNDPAKTVMINGSGVNIEHFTPQVRQNKHITFLLIARIIKSKGIIEYLKAAELIKLKYPNTRILLVGWHESKDESICSSIIDEYVSKNVIEFLGKLDDVLPAFEQSDVYVLPSYREGTPKSVLEAMACAKPIITTDVPGCRETVENMQNGFLIPPKDVNALFDAMEKFILNPSFIEMMGTKSREIAEKKYAVDKVNKTILDSMGLLYV